MTETRQESIDRAPRYLRAQAQREKLAEAEAEIETLRTQRADLASYLNSDKFREDPTVQVVDVLTRLGLR